MGRMRYVNGRSLLVPQRQFQILESLHKQWPFQSHTIAKRAGIKQEDIYNHMSRVKRTGWVNIELVYSEKHHKDVPQYRISELGLAALEYGRLERETK